jgi:hypothetical protein
MRVGSPRDRASWYEVRFIRSTKPISGVISHGLDELCYVSFPGQARYRAGVLAPSSYSRDNFMVRDVYEVGHLRRLIQERRAANNSAG